MPILLRKLLEIDWNSPANRAADWTLALGSLAVGAWLQSPLWIAGGLLGVALAWWRPMARLQARLNAMRVRRRA